MLGQHLVFLFCPTPNQTKLDLTIEKYKGSASKLSEGSWGNNFTEKNLLYLKLRCRGPTQRLPVADEYSLQWKQIVLI